MLNKDIRSKILDESFRLIVEQGYSNTSMRQIAKACSISVGNLCYYFQKKEDLMMHFHNELLDKFISQLPEEIYLADPWEGYFIAEYCFARELLFTPYRRKAYMEVINIPSLRKEYYDRHNQMFLDFLAHKLSDVEQGAIYASTVAMCSLEFNLLEQLPNITNGLDFNRTMAKIFDTRLVFLNIDPGLFSSVIRNSIETASSLEFELRGIR